jgi:predicted amidohydrolase YtcJ
VYGAVTRTTLEGHFPDGWIPKEKISVVEAIRAYTETSAWVEFAEKEKGTLEIGKLADIVILSDDIHVIPSHDIRNVKVLVTIVGGTIVYQA